MTSQPFTSVPASAPFGLPDWVEEFHTRPGDWGWQESSGQSEIQGQVFQTRNERPLKRLGPGEMFEGVKISKKYPRRECRSTLLVTGGLSRAVKSAPGLRGTARGGKKVGGSVA
jgi:hypothetical protein